MNSEVDQLPDRLENNVLCQEQHENNDCYANEERDEDEWEPEMSNRLVVDEFIGEVL